MRDSAGLEGAAREAALEKERDSLSQLQRDRLSLSGLKREEGYLLAKKRGALEDERGAKQAALIAAGAGIPPPESPDALPDAGSAISSHSDPAFAALTAAVAISKPAGKVAQLGRSAKKAAAGSTRSSGATLTSQPANAAAAAAPPLAAALSSATAASSGASSGSVGEAAAATTRRPRVVLGVTAPSFLPAAETLRLVAALHAKICTFADMRITVGSEVCDAAGSEEWAMEIQTVSRAARSVDDAVQETIFFSDEDYAHLPDSAPATLAEWGDVLFIAPTTDTCFKAIVDGARADLLQAVALFWQADPTPAGSAGTAAQAQARTPRKPFVIAP